MIIEVATIILSAGSLFISAPRLTESSAISGVIGTTVMFLDSRNSRVRFAAVPSISIRFLLASMAISQIDMPQISNPPLDSALEIAILAFLVSLSFCSESQMIAQVSIMIMKARPIARKSDSLRHGAQQFLKAHLACILHA
ncbi:hypothetical protein HDN1F_29650 [gamma proteobacterium HdN1]|nr:hypothetical protein HDN1F_29650 [gamma proteobacterium HdN1]